MKVSVESHLKAQGDHQHTGILYRWLDWLLKYRCFLFKGRDATKIWDQLEDAIRVVCLEKESMIRKQMRNYKSKTNFFEMARFDFVVDNDLKVYIMEVSWLDSWLMTFFFFEIHINYRLYLFLIVKLFFRSTCRQICHQLITHKIVYFMNKCYLIYLLLLAWLILNGNIGCVLFRLLYWYSLIDSNTRRLL